MKITKILGLAALFAVVSLALSACGGGAGYSAADADEMIKKSQEGKMEVADYTKCLDWADACLAESVKTIEDAAKTSKSAEEYDAKVEEAGKTMEEKFPKFNEIKSILLSASEEEMGHDNYERYIKYINHAMEQLTKAASAANFDK